MAEDTWAVFRSHLSPGAQRAEQQRRQELERQIKARGEIARITNQRSGGKPLRTPKPPV